MTDVLELVIILYLVYIAFRFISAVYKRSILAIRISKLRASHGAEVSFKKIPFLSLFKLSSTPEITVRLGKALYLVRTYNGSGVGRAVHFASPEFTVRYSRMKTASFSSSAKVKRKIASLSRGFAIGSRVIRLPELCESEDIRRGAPPFDHRAPQNDATKIIPVLIFNPAPGEVSFVTPEKTSIRVAFTGDEIYGTKIFTASTFISYVEREWRAERMADEQAKKEYSTV